MWIVVALCAWGALRAWQQRPVGQPAGVLVADDPQQTPIGEAPSFDVDGGRYRLQPLADFAVHARVLSREDYHLDRLASLVPTDLALGWGPMSDSAVLRQINISQGGRFFYWSTRDFPVPRSEIESHAANMHLIAADEAVRAAIRAVRAGQLVRFEGELVELRARDGWTMRSSLTRTDTGAGACELVWVRHFTIG